MDTTKTLLVLPTRTVSRLRALARRRGTTVSKLMREAVERTYGIRAERKPLRTWEDWKSDPLMRFLESMAKESEARADAPRDLSENHDAYILKALDKKRKRPS